MKTVRYYRTSFGVIGAILLMCTAPMLVQSQTFREDLLEKSSIVFIGTVTTVGQVSFSGVPKSDRTVVVRVDTVVDKPAAIALKAGDSVTIEVKDAAPFRAGVQATFYAEGWILGEGLAVREVGHEVSPARLGAAEMSRKQAEFSQIRKKRVDAALSARLRTADVLVFGRVLRVRKRTMPAMAVQPSRRITEHDPNWQEAVIKVEREIKGAQAGQEIIVRFPGTLDVAWADFPKFKEGQERTFILRRDTFSGIPKAMLAGVEVDAYIARSSEDVLPKEELERVKRLSGQ